jgi:hypothetical protein
MKNSSISWRDGGVAIGNDLHAFSPGSREDARNLIGRVTAAIEVLEGLRKARSAFVEGRADYRDAGSNYRALIDGLDESQKQLSRDLEAVGGLFAPPIPTQRIPASDIVAFVCGIIARLLETGKPSPSQAGTHPDQGGQPLEVKEQG